MAKIKDNETFVRFKDYEGVVPVESMRVFFERSCMETVTIGKRINPDKFADENGFAGYLDKETQAMWIGFALGMRFSFRNTEAISQAMAAVTEQSPREN